MRNTGPGEKAPEQVYIKLGNAPRNLFAKKGITLVEIIVAACVMAMLLSVIYRIFRSSSGVMKAGMWTNNAQNQVRNTLTFLRDEIGRASTFSTVTDSGVQEDPDPKFKLYYKSGTIPKSFSGTILKFYQCRTAISPDPGAKVFCEVKKQGSQLIVNKQVEAGSGATQEKLFTNKVLLEDVTEIKMDSIAAMTNEQLAKALLTIFITVEDPSKSGRKVVEETKAKVDVEVSAL